MKIPVANEKNQILEAFFGEALAEKFGNAEARKGGIVTIVLLSALIFCMIFVSTTGFLGFSLNKLFFGEDEIQLGNAGVNTLPAQYISMLSEKPLHRSQFNLYFREDVGSYELVYVRKGELSDTLGSSTFFLHVYPENPSFLTEELKAAGYFGLDFDNNVKTYQFNDTSYHIATARVPFIPIRQINTGQYGYKGNWNRIWETTVRELPTHILQGLPEDRVISLTVKADDYNKLKVKRQEALRRGVLLTSEGDFISATIEHKGKAMSAQLRLKGDWLDHVRDENKMSFRIELDGEQTILGMSRFSIQHPETRNYLYEWIFQRIMKKQDQIGLRYEFVNVNLNIINTDGSTTSTPIGIYAIEEGFDKLLIESNRRREGILLKFDEQMIWKDRAFAFDAGDGIRFMDDSLQVIGHTSAFSLKKIMSSPDLKKQFYTAKNLVEYYRRDSSSVSRVFDVESVAKFNALSNLFGAEHGLISHNLRFYYNPITSLLEPISFDCEAGRPLTKILFYYHSEKDIEYLTSFAKHLELISSDEFIADVIAGFTEELNFNTKVLQREFPVTGINPGILYENAKVIRKYINPSTAFTAYLEAMSDKEIVIRFKSHTAFPLHINSLRFQGKKDIAYPRTQILKPYADEFVVFDRPVSFDNLFVSKRSKKAGFNSVDHTEDLSIGYQIAGTTTVRTENLVPYPKVDVTFSENDIFRAKPTLEKFKFIHTDEHEKLITIAPGEHIISEDLILPAGYLVVGAPGMRINLQDSAKIISRSPLNFTGTNDNPIKIYSSDRTGQGLLVMSTKGERSIVRFVHFEGLSNLQNFTWSVSGAVNFYDAPVSIEFSAFTDNRCEDALNIIRTEFTMNGVVFERTESDAFDGDFVKGKITNSRFTNLGNDAIDVSGSDVTIDSIKIQKAGDKAISVGERSKLTGARLVIEDGEIAIVSKDLSEVSISDVLISNCHLGFTAYRKKPEYGNARIDANNIDIRKTRTKHLIENGSSLLLNGKPIQTEKEVVGRLYGVEFGKASN